MDPDELDEVFDSEVGERLDAVFSDAIDPEAAILGVHFAGDVRRPVLVLAEVLSDAIDVVTRWTLLTCVVIPLERRVLMPASSSRAEVRPADEPDGRRCGRGYR